MIFISGLFLEAEDSHVDGEGGLLKTGQWYIIAIQSLSCLTTIVWTAVTAFIMLKVRGFI